MMRSIIFLAFLFLPSPFLFCQTPELVADLNPDGPSFPNRLAEYEGKLYFQALGKLWATDPQTGDVKNIGLALPNGVDTAYTPRNFTAYKGKLFFIASLSPVGDFQSILWTTDGMQENATPFGMEENGNGFAAHGHFLEYKNELYFIGNDGLWKTDGTVENTKLAVEMIVSFNWITELNGRLILSLNSAGAGFQVWSSDGTTDGTFLVKTFEQGITQYDVFNSKGNGEIYFKILKPGNIRETWATDGTAEGTYVLSEKLPLPEKNTSHLFFNGKHFLIGTDSIYGSELWVTDGTVTGTHLLKDIREGAFSGSPKFLTVHNDKIYFAAADSISGGNIWTTDGTSENTVKILDNISVENPFFPRRLAIYNDHIYFIRHQLSGCELWKSNINQNNPEKINPPVPIEHCFLLHYPGFEYVDCFDGFKVAGDYLYFAANYDKADCELYRIYDPNIEEYDFDCGELNFHFFPNPVQEKGHLIFESEKKGNISVRAFDISGRYIGELIGETELSVEYKQVNFDIPPNFSNGIYLLQIRGENCRKWVRMCVAR